MVMKPTDIHQILVFHDLPPHIVRPLSDIATPQTVKARQVLFHQGDAASHLYFVQKGCLRLIEHTPMGQDVSLHFFGEGDLLGLQALIDDGIFPGRVEAIALSNVIRFNGQDFVLLMQQYPELSKTVVHLLIQRLHLAHQRIRELTTERVEKRLARTLLRYSERFGVTTHEGVEIGLRQQDLAEFIGTTIETVSRTLTQWEKEALLACGRQRIVIKNVGELSQFIQLT